MSNGFDVGLVDFQRPIVIGHRLCTVNATGSKVELKFLIYRKSVSVITFAAQVHRLLADSSHLSAFFRPVQGSDTVIRRNIKELQCLDWRNSGIQYGVPVADSFKDFPKPTFCDAQQRIRSGWPSERRPRAKCRRSGSRWAMRDEL